MVSVQVADGAAAGGPRRAYERPAFIAAAIGLVAVAVLVFVRPGTTTSAVDATAIEVTGPQGIAPDEGAAPPEAAPVAPPQLGRYAAQTKLTLVGDNSGGRTTTNRDVQFEVLPVQGGEEGAPLFTMGVPRGGTRNVIAFRDDGAYLVARESLDGCVFDQPLKRWASPMAVGDAWSAEGSCTQEGGRGRGPARDVSLTLSSQVTGTKQVTVGDAVLQTFVIETSLNTSEKADFRGNQQVITRVEREVQLFAPQIGLPVELTSNIATVIRNGSEEQRIDSTQTLTLLVTQPGGTG